MPRKEDANAAEAVKRVLTSKGPEPDHMGIAASKARALFDLAMREGMAFEQALGSIYQQAIVDYVELTPKRRRASRRKAVAQPTGENNG